VAATLSDLASFNLPDIAAATTATAEQLQKNADSLTAASKQDERVAEVLTKASFLSWAKWGAKMLKKDHPDAIPQKEFWLKDGWGKMACDEMVKNLLASRPSWEQGELSFYTASQFLRWLTFRAALKYVEQCVNASENLEDQEMMKNLGDAWRERLEGEWVQGRR
jgi:hypothetical protein